MNRPNRGGRYVQIIVEKKGYRLLPLLAMAIVAALLLLFAQDTQAGHTNGAIELDVRSGDCPDPNGPDPAPPDCGDANQINDGGDQPGTSDWVDVCSTYDAEGETPPTPPAVLQPFFDDDILVKDTLPAEVSVASCTRDYFKPDQTYFDSEKDIFDICGAADSPCAGSDPDGSLGDGGVPAGKDWECVELNSPLPKNEILNAYAAYTTPAQGASSGDDVVYFGIEREGVNGTAFMALWFLQTDASCQHAGNGFTSFSGGPHAVRCGILTAPAGCLGGVSNVGDILVMVNYTGGGKIATVFVTAWDPGLDDCAPNPNNSDPLCVVATGADCTSVAADDDACAVVNTRDLDPACGDATCYDLAPWNNNCVKVGSDACNSGTRITLEPNAFYEGNLNLTNIFGDDIPCFSTFVAETRSSDEFTATLKDNVTGEFDTCGKATIIKQTDPDDASGTFSYTSGLPCGDFDLVDADATPAEGEDGVHVCNNLIPDTYYVTEDDPTTLDPPFELVDIDCNVDVDGGTSYRIGRFEAGSFVNGGTDEYDDGDDTVELNIGTLGEITCTYTNRQRGSILVRKEDEDGALLPGACFTFDPDPADGSGSAVEVCDGATGDEANGDDGLVCVDNVVFGDYDITESQAPPGYEGDSDTETVTVDSISNCADRLSGTPTPDATFVNKLGTILIHKVSSKSSSTFVGGACFTIDDDAANPVAFSGTVCDDDFDTADLSDTDSTDGVICVEDVPLGSYDITETTVPDGYAGDDSTVTVVVDDSDSCADKASTPDATFVNIPLADIQIRFRDAGSGETFLDQPLDCDNSTGTESTADTTGWDDTLTIEDIEVDPSPITITCTIVIDP
jgi:hypothetical protein